jgi:peptide/nickel transport system permease protein
MRRYIGRRLVQMVPLVIGISLLAYAIIRFAPGDPTQLLVDREQATVEQYATLRVQLGLDDPIPVQYMKTMTALFTGELRSFRTKQRVVDMVAERLPTTLLLSTLAVAFGLLVGIVIGIIQALRPYSRFDNAGTFLALLGFSMPNFWLALMLIMLFAVRLRWLPASGIRPLGTTGWDPLAMAPYLVLPTIVLGTGLLASVSRYVRSSMLEALNQDYMRTARAKGLRERTVVIRHALRNSLLPVITLIGFYIPFLIGGAVITETIFALPGMGRLAIDAVFIRDYPVILTITIFSSIAVIVGNLVADVLYTVADPRIRYA